MKHNLKKLNSNQIKLTVELNQGDIQKYVNRAEVMLGGGLKVDGFRKGKVPKDLLKQHLDQGKVKSLALEVAIQESLSYAVKDNSLEVLETSQLSVDKNEADCLVYSVVLDLFPEVKLADLAKIKVKRESTTGISDKDVDNALDFIKNSRANFIDKDRDAEVENGDRVEVDFEVKKDGQIIEGGVSKNHPLIIGGRNFIPGFEEQLIGMDKGQEKSFSLVAPVDYFHKEISGKKLDFRVKVNDIKKVVASEINDEFAKKVGQFSNLKELRDSVREGLVQENKFKEDQKLRLEILGKIISNSEIEVPGNMVGKQLDIMVSDFDSNLHEKGLELGLYLAKIGKTEEELKNDWKKEAEKQVKISLVLRRVVRDANIKVSEDEIDEATNQFIQAAIVRREVNQDNIDVARIRENIAVKMTNEKALEHLESHCSV